MNHVIFIAVLGGVLLGMPIAAQASGRYAIVVGNNHGHTTELKLDDLLHAEREAKSLRDRLIRFGNFDPDRVKLVVGKGLGGIIEAAKDLAQRRARDRQNLGPLPTLFAFFFTGHGAAGKLLTNDEPVTGKELAWIFKEIDATLTLGFFDACYAGSLQLDPLRAMGIQSTPGFNPIKDLPEEVLNSEGTMWFVSSQPDQLSYEDDNLGGLFTHYFTEAFLEAPTDGVGISLDNMWEYARRRTAERASQHGREQTPEMIVRDLTTRGPLVFSFPLPRTAWLTFDQDVRGSFLVRYINSALVEKIEKRPGQTLEVAMYEGEAVLSQIRSQSGQDEKFPSRHLTLEAGSEIYVRPHGAALPAYGPGFGEATIRSKGDLPGLSLSWRQERLEISTGAGYRFSYLPSNLLGGTHFGVLNARLVNGGFTFGVELGIGGQEAVFPAWSYTLMEYGLLLSGGYGFDLGGLRVDAELASQLSIIDARYSSGTRRVEVGGFFGGFGRVRIPAPLIDPWVVFEIQAGLGVRLSPTVVVADGGFHATPAPMFGASMTFPVLDREAICP